MRQLLLCTLLIALTSLTLSAQKFPNLAPTPPMGWNSWNFYGCNIDENKVKLMADAMASNGMKDAGYRYIVIDDCWQVLRDNNGYIIADTAKFPSGIKSLADYVHSKGLKFGIYSCGGTKTCAGRPGSAGFERQDAEQYAKWGVDYLKFDWCNANGLKSTEEYAKMRDALYKAGHPIVFSLCEWGSTKPWLWADTVGQLWRTTGDIQDKFAKGHGVLKIFDESTPLRRYNKPNAWNDPDMLEVGNKGLNYTESRTHFTLWCMLAAPLMAGNDLHAMDKDILNVLNNKDAVAVNQDPLGIQCFLWDKNNGIEVWIKPLADSSYAVCFLNRSENAKPIVDFNWKQQAIDNDFNKIYTIDDSYTIFDIWKNKEIGKTDKKLTTTINSRDVLFVRLKKK